MVYIKDGDSMIPFCMKAESLPNNILELILDTQGRMLVGYYIKSKDNATHTIDVSYDGENYYPIDTIVFDSGGEQTAVGREYIPWRYVRLKTITKGKHYYELIAK